MNRSYRFIAALVAVFVLAFFGCARTPEERAARFVDHISDELKLNDAQKVQLNKIKDEYLARRIDALKFREDNFNEIIELLKSDTIDKARLDALTDKSLGRADDMVKFFFTKFAEFHDMLTPEQRAKAAEAIIKHHEEHHR